MKTYIGTKIIEAVPAIRKGVRVYEEGQPTPKSMDPVEEGYKVRYPDGYESFSPKAVFEAAYRAEHAAIGNKAIAFCGTSGVQMGWLASQADMLADDWEIVE